MRTQKLNMTIVNLSTLRREVPELNGWEIEFVSFGDAAYTLVERDAFTFEVNNEFNETVREKLDNLLVEHGVQYINLES